MHAYYLCTYVRTQIGTEVHAVGQRAGEEDRGGRAEGVVVLVSGWGGGVGVRWELARWVEGVEAGAWRVS